MLMLYSQQLLLIALALLALLSAAKKNESLTYLGE